ncbi:MAG: UDP-2,3-diacylglucosamine diphosphatase [Candidatus Thiodiazotropha sp. LLP2]
MTHQLFISDLHLSAEGAGRLRLFNRFLESRAPQADSIYILGDLFDAWLGDDVQLPILVEVKQALKRLSDAGTQLKVMHGNRDFLIGEAFCRDTGAELISDPNLVDINGIPTLLMHGDLLCTDDLAYQQFRKEIRAPAFVNHFLSLPIPERITIAQDYRAKSGEANSLKSEAIMDVNQLTVEDYLQQHQAQCLIHGHTHRPADHTFKLGSHSVSRHVLGEWHADHAEILCVAKNGLSRETFRL